MKKFFAAILSALLITVCAFSGCMVLDGANGKDGHNLSIYDLLEAANAERRAQGLEELDLLEFLKEYFNYSGDDINEVLNLQSAINRSLLSSVSIISGFHTSKFSTKLEYFAGSGVIVDIDTNKGDAYILTNCHVVYTDSPVEELAVKVFVYLYGYEQFTSDGFYGESATILGASTTYDLALIKVSGSSTIKYGPYKAATFAPDEEVYPGQQVFAIGNPEGSGLSASVGIVSRESETIELSLSAVNPNIYKEYRVIRTDAAINGGNSGGGLFNSSGQLVGIINSKSVSEEIENMGYALAGSYAKRVAKLFKDGYGKISGSDFYFERAPFPVDYRYTYSTHYDSERNLIIIEDLVRLKADYGMLRTNDQVLKIRILNGNEVVEDVDITRYFLVDDVMLSARRGYTVEVTVHRTGVEEDIVATFEPVFKSYSENLK